MKLMLESILAAGLSAARRSALPSALMLGSILAAGLTGGAVFSAAGEPLPFKIPAAVADVQDFQTPDRVHLDGWIGSRIAGRLATIDMDRLLEGYRHRPGRQSWDGEHVGKWLHAATLAWVNTGDPALRAKLDYTVAELSKCQLADGYLGTYLDKDRWTEWDVWAHKYNLIGLLTYVQYTGNQEPLPVCRRMADLLCRTFGDTPGKRDIIPAGEHAGMAPTSVLEPMVLLYRMTGEERYLDFCKYILRSWEQDNGPHIISRLLELKRVDKVGDAKAYEMLSCLNGALEYYRATGGDRKILEACLNAWGDIVNHRLYLTGAASYYEVFHDDFDLPNTDDVGETCVTRARGAQPTFRRATTRLLGVGILRADGRQETIQDHTGRKLLSFQRPTRHRAYSHFCRIDRRGWLGGESVRSRQGHAQVARWNGGHACF